MNQGVTMNRKFLTAATLSLFLVLFNAGYVFHELLLGEWLRAHEAAIAREEFIIPLIALAFLVYSFLLSYFYVIYAHYFAGPPRLLTAVRFAVLMGVIWDALQGGIIEVATFNMPFIVFVVDSGYHVLVEGSIAGVILHVVSRRWPTRQA
jgi:hypothetical protein